MISVAVTTVVLGAIAWLWFVRQFSLLGPAEVVVMQDFRSGAEWKILGMDGPDDRPWAYAAQVRRPRSWASDTVIDLGFLPAIADTILGVTIESDSVVVHGLTVGATTPSRIATFPR